MTSQPHTLWTFIRTSFRWVEFKTFPSRIEAVEHLRKRGTDQYTRTADDKYPVWYIKPAGKDAPSLPIIPKRSG